MTPFAFHWNQDDFTNSWAALPICSITKGRACDGELARKVLLGYPTITDPAIGFIEMKQDRDIQILVTRAWRDGSVG